MNFNRFQAAENQGNFPQVPPLESEPRGWEPPNNQQRSRNHNRTDTPNHLGLGEGYGRNDGNNFRMMGPQSNNNQPVFQRVMETSVGRQRQSLLGAFPQPTYYSNRSTGPNYLGTSPFLGRMPLSPFRQYTPCKFCCQYPLYNAPQLGYPGKPIVMVRTPYGQWVQPMDRMVDVYGASATATVDLGDEFSPPPNHLTQHEQPETGHGQLFPEYEVRAAEQQHGSQSSQETRDYVSIIIEEPNETGNRKEAVEDSASTLTPKAGPSSGCQRAQLNPGPSVEGCEEQLQKMNIARLDGDDQPAKKSSKKRKPKRRRKRCRLCLNNGEAPEVYQSHNVVDGMGVTTCPILRAQVCPLCKRTGDKAHTLKYCPTNIQNRRWYWRQRIRDRLDAAGKTVQQ